MTKPSAERPLGVSEPWAPSRGTRRARRYDLIEGQRPTGKVLQTPRAGAIHGNYLILQTASAPVAIAASAARGGTVLARELARQAVVAGDRVAITYAGMRISRDGERRYRSFQVAILTRAEQVAK